MEKNMSRAFKLPDLGEGIHEGEVIAVLVSVGDEVNEGDPILEVETDKASVEIPSPYTAKVLQIMVQPGDVIKVGDVMITFSNGGEGFAEATTEKKPAEPAATTAAPEMPPAGKKGPVPASPSTRRLARELGVDLYRVSPTGTAGLVTADDVRSFAGKKEAAEGEKGDPLTATTAAVPLEKVAAAAPPLPDFSKWGPVQRLPLRSIRRATAKQMALAWSQIPHVNSQDDVDVTRFEDFRRRQKSLIESQGGKLTLTVFAVKAAAATLRKFPNFNVSLDPGKGEIIRKDYYHVGVATDTGDGLVVPVIRDADRKSITEIAIELSELVQRARSRKIGLEELQGGTFTVTNIGAAGGRGHMAPIINYPEAAILGMGQARMQPVVTGNNDGEYDIVPRLILPVVLAIDHRVLDGVDAAKFLDFFRRTLEDPERFLLSI
jgi:pyruvate dehydrogenase E2 component (dihydrolipoamide acetyltransferase)